MVDKPAGWTSHDVVNKLRRFTGERSIGHLGTLDPMATGVLPLVVGRATRLARFFTANDKRYDAMVRFGITTDSYDRDGEVVASTTDFHLDADQLERTLDAFRGTFPQTPPPVSAKKVSGTRAYKLARQHIPVELKPIEATVFSLEMREFEGCQARLLIHCAGGVYVRSIVHDWGQKLGCGAMLDGLRRTSSGIFTEQQAISMAALEALASEQNMNQAVIPAAELLQEFPCERVDALTAGQIRQGRDFRVSPFRTPSGAQYVRAIGEDGELVAIGEAKLPHVYHPILVM